MNQYDLRNDKTIPAYRIPFFVLCALAIRALTTGHFSGLRYPDFTLQVEIVYLLVPLGTIAVVSIASTVKHVRFPRSFAIMSIVPLFILSILAGGLGDDDGTTTLIFLGNQVNSSLYSYGDIPGAALFFTIGSGLLRILITTGIAVYMVVYLYRHYVDTNTEKNLQKRD